MGLRCSRYLCEHSNGLRYKDVQVQSDEEEETNPDDRGGCILAHNMGLGKSFQTIAFLHSYHHHFPGQHTLVVMPKNVLWNWKEEFNLWLSLTKGSELTVEKVRLSRICNQCSKNIPTRCKCASASSTTGKYCVNSLMLRLYKGGVAVIVQLPKCPIKRFRTAFASNQGYYTVCCPEDLDSVLGSCSCTVTATFRHLHDHPLAALRALNMPTPYLKAKSIQLEPNK